MPPLNVFWRHQPLEQLRQEQGGNRPQQVTDLLGTAADLWDDDANFQAFQDWLADSRKQERRIAQQALEARLTEKTGSE